MSHLKTKQSPNGQIKSSSSVWLGVECLTECCIRPVYACWLCESHYSKQLRREKHVRQGTTYFGRFLTKVNKTGTCWLWEGGRIYSGYGTFKARELPTTLAHRASYMMFVGSIPEDMEIDHTCHIRHCVNPAHLRLATRAQNVQNRRGSGNNSGGSLGVFKLPSGRYSANAGARGTNRYLGTFDTLEEAAEIARLRRVQLFTHNVQDRLA